MLKKLLLVLQTLLFIAQSIYKFVLQQFCCNETVFITSSFLGLLFCAVRLYECIVGQGHFPEMDMGHGFGKIYFRFTAVHDSANTFSLLHDLFRH